MASTNSVISTYLQRLQMSIQEWVVAQKRIVGGSDPRDRTIHEDEDEQPHDVGDMSFLHREHRCQ